MCLYTVLRCLQHIFFSFLSKLTVQLVHLTLHQQDSLDAYKTNLSAKEGNPLLKCLLKCLSLIQAFISKHLFYRYKSICYMTDNSTSVPNKIQPSISFNIEEPARFEK